MALLSSPKPLPGDSRKSLANAVPESDECLAKDLVPAARRAQSAAERERRGEIDERLLRRDDHRRGDELAVEKDVRAVERGALRGHRARADEGIALCGAPHLERIARQAVIPDAAAPVEEVGDEVEAVVEGVEEDARAEPGTREVERGTLEYVHRDAARDGDRISLGC